MFEDPWDAAHITTWNFLPSLLRHIGVAPLWVVHVLYGAWLAAALALVFASLRLVRILRLPETAPASSPNGNRISPEKPKKTQTQP
jgi:hypothetical protein